MRHSKNSDCLKKDELTDSVEKYEDFEDFQRAENQSVNEHIQSFDAKYRKLEKLNKVTS